jgi:muconolactone delta-isomerase
MFRAKYPASSLKRAIEVFQSPETPKPSDAGKEVATFVHGDHGGYTNYLLFDVDETRVGELVNAQAPRTIHMEARVPGLSIELLLGHSIPDAISIAMKQLPR